MWAKHGRNVTPQRIGQENARRHSHVFFCSEPTAWPFNDATPNWIITVHIICMYKLYMCYDEKQRRYTYINISKICAYIYIYIIFEKSICPRLCRIFFSGSEFCSLWKRENKTWLGYVKIQSMTPNSQFKYQGMYQFKYTKGMYQLKYLNLNHFQRTWIAVDVMSGYPATSIVCFVFCYLKVFQEL